MSDYVNKRIEYINNWPNVRPFEAEENYKIRCNNFINKNNRHPLSLMKLWVDTDDNYNRTISHFIDSIDVMPCHPNFAFSFIFSAIDHFAKWKYPNPKPDGKPNITISFKLVADDIFDLSLHNNDVKDIIDLLFSVTPVSATSYLYKSLSQNSKAYGRVTKDIYDHDVVNNKSVVDAIFHEYGYDPSNFNDSIRQAALLYRKMFFNDSISIRSTAFTITNNLRLHLLLSGIIYSLRNDSLHGSSMSSTKSSQTSPKRYAMNYYCYITTYSLLMIILVKNSILSETEKNLKYTQLKNITLRNVNDFRDLFGNHIK